MGSSKQTKEQSMNDNTQEKSRTGVFLVLIAGLLWGTMGIWVRNLNAAGITTGDITLLRSLGMVFLLGLYGLFFRRSMFRIRLKDIWCFLGTGIVSILFFNYCYMTTITRTSLSVAALLLYTSPAFVLIGSSLLFRERFTLRKLLALFMAFFGCVCISGIFQSAETISPRNLAVGIGAGFGYAMYSIFGHYALKRGYGGTTITFYTFLIASAGMLPFGAPVKVFHILSGDISLLPYVPGLIVICTLIPYLSYTAGLNRMETGLASIVACVEPVAATLVGFFLYREKLSGSELLGILFVLGSVVVINLKKPSQKA